MANVVYDNLKEQLLSGDIDLDDDTLKVMLVQEFNATITTSADEMPDALLDVTEVGTSAVGYPVSGTTMTGVVISAGSTPFMDADDITYANSTIDAGGLIIYEVTGNGKPLVYIDFGTIKSSFAGDFKIQWNTGGIISMSS